MVTLVIFESQNFHCERSMMTQEKATVRPDSEQLSRSLKPRHLSMIALGGAIGAGLLVASSTAIVTAGPAVIISYAIAGLVLTLVMRMLGEMASASPETGSFESYANRFIGSWAGFSVGWLYWWFWSVTVAIEATAAAAIVHQWSPTIPQWAAAGTLVVLMMGLNLVTVRTYGEAEFWFSSIKIGAILAVIIVGVLALIGIIPNTPATFQNLTAGGGFFANGIGAVFTAVLAVIFSMFGAEIVTIAAGESEHPQAAVTKAVSAVVFRILFFFIGAVGITITVAPWTSISSGHSPFVTMFEVVGIPYAGLIMNIVVFTALVSCLNAALYTSSRMLFSMAHNGNAPATFGKVSRFRSPGAAVIFSSLIGLASVLLNYFMPEAVFALLVNSTGAIGIFVWLIIAISQLRSRKVLAAQGVNVLEQPGVLKMWLFPYLNWALIAALCALLVFMAVTESHRVEVLISTTVAAVVVTLGVWNARRQKKA